MEENVSANVDTVVGSAVAEESIPQKKQRKPINQQKLQDNIWGWAFCLPLIIGTVWFVYAAFIMALMLSFTSYTLGYNLMEYLGSFGEHIHPNGAFYNYIYAFTNQLVTDYPMNEMGAYLFNTVFYLIGIPIGMILSMFFAVCMSRDIKGGNLFRVLYYIPCVASAISIVYTFKIMFDTTGVINQLCGLTNGTDGFYWIRTDGTAAYTWATLNGIEGAEGAFLNDPFWCQGIITKCVVVIMSVWKGLGGTIILYVAGLSGVNGATKEAAQIDGANGWQIFWKVTMPDLYPTIFYNIVTAVIGGMQIYMEPVLLADESYMYSGYVSLIWLAGFDSRASNPALGAAYGMILAVIIFALTMFQFWLDSRNKD